MVDPLLLETNKMDPEYNPSSAIIKEFTPKTIKNHKEIEETIDIETYKRYYSGALRKHNKPKKKSKKRTKKRTKNKK